MSSAPTIRLINTQDMRWLIDPKFSYVLYGDDDSFQTWKDWVKDSANSPAYNEVNNHNDYDGYVLKIFCDTNT